ncbi:hypothetical protein BDR04DRAFT_657367 [Suillus decipiens]|nr:hypothetical protein BDR04DRAFT_657367 [Suillus decipiens]
MRQRLHCRHHLGIQRMLSDALWTVCIFVDSELPRNLFHGGHMCALCSVSPRVVRFKTWRFSVLRFLSSLVLFTLTIYLVILGPSYHLFKPSICLSPHTAV